MRLIKLVTRSALVCALFVLTPLTFTAEGGVDENLACSREQTPDCKRQIDSVCTAGSKPVMNYYTVAEL
jgi:hypothetical protein